VEEKKFTISKANISYVVHFIEERCVKIKTATKFKSPLSLTLGDTLQVLANSLLLTHMPLDADLHLRHYFMNKGWDVTDGE